MFRRIPGILVSVMALVLILAPASSAQTGSIVPGTITVMAEGTASAPAEQASVVITIGSDGNVWIDPMDPAAIMPDGTATPDEINVTPIIDEIVAFGIPVNDIEVVNSPFMGEWGAGMIAEPVSLLIMVDQPTVEGLSDLLEVTRTAAHAEGLFVNNFGVMYSVENCRALRSQARTNAVENARQEAEDQAAALDVTIGNVSASRDSVPMSMGYYQTNSCNIMPMAIPFGITHMAGQFDPGMPAEVIVSVAVEVSFDIP